MKILLIFLLFYLSTVHCDDNEYMRYMEGSAVNSEDHDDYNDPRIPADVFTQEEKRKGFVVLHLAGACFVMTGVAFLTHHFLIAGVEVGIRLDKFITCSLGTIH